MTTPLPENTELRETVARAVENALLAADIAGETYGSKATRITEAVIAVIYSQGDGLREALRLAKHGLKTLTEFADPEEIMAEPEEFGGTDDGAETVIMAYENMQFTAANCLRDVERALAAQEGNSR